MGRQDELWAPGYFVRTVGDGNTDQSVQRYIQRDADRLENDGQLDFMARLVHRRPYPTGVE